MDKGQNRWNGLFDLPYDAEGWIFVFNREPETGIILVVPQFYVIPRMMFLDEMVLQNESFFFRVGDNRFNICHRSSRVSVLASLPFALWK